MTDKEVAWNIFQLTMSDDEPFDKILDIQSYYGQGRIGCPTVVYYPDRLEHLCFPTPWEANRYMLKEKP